MLALFLALMGCQNPGSVNSNTTFIFQVTPFGVDNLWQNEDGVDVNLDGVKVGVTGEEITIPAGTHVATFGSMSRTITTGNGVEIPVVTSASGQTWIAPPREITSGPSRERHAEGHTGADTGTDTGTPPADPPVQPVYMTEPGTYTCQGSTDTTDILENVSVAYPTVDALDASAFGVMSVSGVLLNIPSNGTEVLKGNFELANVFRVNIQPVDPTTGTDRQYDCWFGTLADRPWPA